MKGMLVKGILIYQDNAKGGDRRLVLLLHKLLVKQDTI
jgi:hypothetical protein